MLYKDLLEHPEFRTDSPTKTKVWIARSLETKPLLLDQRVIYMAIPSSSNFRQCAAIAERLHTKPEIVQRFSQWVEARTAPKDPD